MVEKFVLINDDCLIAMKQLPDESVDSIVTDPPYGLKFMGKKWDHDVPSVEIWEECFRVLKPGGYLLSFGGTRTYHRLVVNVEDAGFEIRDMINWVYGSGFPKSHNISMAIDKAAGKKREVIGKRQYINGSYSRDTATMGTKNGIYGSAKGGHVVTAPNTDEAIKWDGWGTALKPAHEPIVLARKPFKGTVANNVLEHGTGGLNIDDCRVETKEDLRRPSRGEDNGLCNSSTFKIRERKICDQVQHVGRFPANLIHDGSDGVEEIFPHTKSGTLSGNTIKAHDGFEGKSFKRKETTSQHRKSSEGSASRFFYCAKTSKKERGEGNNHPTVKPIALMEYLCRLVTQPNGVILDPFMGSGSTGLAALNEKFRFVGIELDCEYYKIAEDRISNFKGEQQ